MKSLQIVKCCRRGRKPRCRPCNRRSRTVWGSHGAGCMRAGNCQSLAQFAQDIPGLKTLAVDAPADSAPDQVFAALQPDILVICAGALSSRSTPCIN